MKTIQNHPTGVRRGIQSSVFNQTEPESIRDVVVSLNNGFTDFKAKYNERLDALQNGVDEATIKLSGMEMGAGIGNTHRPSDTPSQAGVMRTKAQFTKHYASRTNSTEPVELADFLRGVAGMKTTAAVQAALSVGTSTAGGYSVPAQTMPQILSALTPVSSLLQAGAGIALMEDGAKTQTTAAIETLPTAAWRNESGNIAESEPVFRGIVAQPRSLAFYFKVSRELLADGSGINQGLETAIAAAFAKKLDYTGLMGSGIAPEPTGLLNTAGVISITSGANGTALTNYSKFFEATQGLLDGDAPMPTAAIVSPRSLVKLGGLLDSTGQPVNVPPMLQPLKMIASSQVSNALTVGSSSDCSLIFVGDFTRLYFLMRESLSIQLLREAFATTGELAFLCHVRADIVVSYPKAFAVIKGVRA